MSAYYNEIDGAAAHVLECLIAENVIAPGVVDRRSIRDVQPSDLDGFTQCHFFAGGGLWSVAARLAGWPDSKPLWTGSCPCQPFSVAGKGAGIDDIRHLWPDFFRLIRARRPSIVVGEQVAGAAGYGWLDGVRSDLAGEDYASRGVDIPALAVDAPHIRQRLYWLAVADARREFRGSGPADAQDGIERPDLHGSCGAAGLANANRGGCAGRPEDAQRGALGRDAAERAVIDDLGDAGRQGLAFGSVTEIGSRDLWDERATALPADFGGDMANADKPFWRVGNKQPAGQLAIHEQDAGIALRAGSRNGSFWSDAEWIVCHDGKARRAKPSLCFLVDGLPGRVDLWRIGGNAISPVLAAEVLASFLETEVRAAA